MGVWFTIDTAPRDGTPVIAAKESSMWPGNFPYPLTCRFINGEWCSQFGIDDWRSFDPQPTHWQPSGTT